MGRFGDLFNKAAGLGVDKPVPSELPETIPVSAGAAQKPEMTRESMLFGLAEQLDLSKQVTGAPDEQFQGVAQTALDFALPDTTDAVGMIGSVVPAARFAGLVGKGAHGLAEVNKIVKAGDTAADLYAASKKIGRGVTVVPSAADKLDMARKAALALKGK